MQSHYMFCVYVACHGLVVLKPSTLVPPYLLAFEYCVSSLENPMDGGAWKPVVHGVVKSWIQLSDFTSTFHFHALEKAIAFSISSQGTSKYRELLISLFIALVWNACEQRRVARHLKKTIKT